MPELKEIGRRGKGRRLLITNYKKSIDRNITEKPRTKIRGFSFHSVWFYRRDCHPKPSWSIARQNCIELKQIHLNNQIRFG